MQCYESRHISLRGTGVDLIDHPAVLNVHATQGKGCGCVLADDQRNSRILASFAAPEQKHINRINHIFIRHIINRRIQSVDH